MDTIVFCWFYPHQYLILLFQDMPPTPLGQLPKKTLVIDLEECLVKQEWDVRIIGIHIIIIIIFICEFVVEFRSTM